MNIEGCSGCEIPKTVNLVRGQTIVEMEGGWLLNHCGGGQTYLGRLVLQTKNHRSTFGDLSLKEASTLGTNLQHIDNALRCYWSLNFCNDILQRVYVIYFNEDPKYHFHIHLLPRTIKMLGKNNSIDVAAWKILSLLKEDWFPDEYRIVDKCNNSIKINEDRVTHLMQYMNGIAEN